MHQQETGVAARGFLYTDRDVRLAAGWADPSARVDTVLGQWQPLTSAIQATHGHHRSVVRGLAAGWADPGARLLREWALRPGLGARVAIINALYAGGAPVQRMLPVLIAESLRRDRCASAAHSLVVPHFRWTVL